MYNLYNDVKEENQKINNKLTSLQKEINKLKEENEKLKSLNGNMIKILEQVDEPEIINNIDIIKTD